MAKSTKPAASAEEEELIAPIVEETTIEETPVELTPIKTYDGLPSRGYRSPGNLPTPVVVEDGGQE